MRTKPSVAVERQRPAVGGEHETPDDVVDAGGRGLVGRQADLDDLRIGEAHLRDDRWSQVLGLPGDHLGDQLALGHRPVGEHRLAGDVADGEHVAHRRAALVVDRARQRPSIARCSDSSPARR